MTSQCRLIIIKSSFVYCTLMLFSIILWETTIAIKVDKVINLSLSGDKQSIFNFLIL